MKKALIILLIALSMFTVGCKNSSIDDGLKDNEKETTENSNENDSADIKNDLNEEEEEEQVISKYSLNEYVGINANEKYNYSGENSEYAEFTRFVDYIDGSKYQIRTNNGGTEIVRVIEVNETEIKVNFKRAECYYRENFLNKPANESEILLKTPIAKGTEWTLADGSKRFISSIDATINTNVGEYQCVEVTTENKEGQKDLQYYAPGIGLLKEVKDAENMKVTSTLDSIEGDTAFNQSVRFYLPDNNAEYMYYEDVQISFGTNDITRFTLQNKFREYNIIKDSVAINSLYLNDDGMVYLDLSSNFVPEMANGTAGEYYAIYGLVNSLGRYYGVNQVYVTLDGGSYESGHILKAKGESFTVDLSRVQ